MRYPRDIDETLIFITCSNTLFWYYLKLIKKIEEKNYGEYDAKYEKSTNWCG